MSTPGLRRVVIVTLVRHGATSGNDEGRFHGSTDAGLSARGWSQVSDLAPRLPDRFDGVWASDKRRTVETARRLGWEPTPDRRLRELDFGRLEGSVWDDLDASTQAQLLAFNGFHAPGGESVEIMRSRMESFLDALSSGCHLVVTHAGPFRAALQACGSDVHPRTCQAAEINWTTKEILTEDLAAN